MDNPKENKQMPKVPKIIRIGKPSPVGFLLIALILITIIMAKERLMPVEQIQYGDFETYLNSGYVESVEIGNTTLRGKFNELEG